jgi:hypothetical protein
VEGSGCSKVLEWNSFQGIDAIEKKYPDCSDIAGNFSDTLKQFETSPLVSSDYFLSNERSGDINGQSRLGDPRIGALLG